MSAPFRINGVDRVHLAVYALTQAELNGVTLEINSQVVTLLANYQRCCTDYHTLRAQLAQITRLPWWQRWHHRHGYLRLKAEVIRMTARKRLLEHQLAQVDIILPLDESLT